MRRGIDVKVSNSALAMTYSIGVFADVFPPSGETRSDDDFFLYHERTNDGDVVKVRRRTNGHVILSWAVTTACWVKLALKSIELGT